MDVGTASAEPGTVANGYLDVATLPTGTPERLPVILARGVEDGPTLWLTGGVHGNEVTGVATVQEVLSSIDPGSLAGTVVGVPICNPAGLRRVERTSYYHGDDPNRYFPPRDEDATVPERVQERIDARLYEAIVDSADALLDVHTAQLRSTPFVIRDRVLYDADDESADDVGNAEYDTTGGDEASVRERGHRDETTASELADQLSALAAATALPVVTEFRPEEYRDRNLHRSAAGAVLNEGGIPALTLELGSYGVIEPGPLAAGVGAACRAMVELGMLATVPEEISRADPGYTAPVSSPVRRHVGPRVESAGLLRHHVESGDVVTAGEPIADVVDPHGDVLETVDSKHDGYVLGRASPVVYENDAVASLAVRDEEPLVAPRESE